jgi:hypothetical protein
MEVTESDKHSSLIPYGIDNFLKKCYKKGPDAFTLIFYSYN